MYLIKDFEVWLKFAETVEKIDNSNAKPRGNSALKPVRAVVRSRTFNKPECTNGSNIRPLFPIVQLSR
jgi:hypothetical protein